MKHNIPIDEFGPLAADMADAVTKCVHCGFCLPACPTYKLLNEEMDSPRGRIILMKSVLEGDVDLEEAAPYIDHCLGCLSCQSVCPSGVLYGELLSPYRAIAEDIRQRPLKERFSRWVTKETLPYPSRFRLATSVGRIAKSVPEIIPDQFSAMLDLLPAEMPESDSLPTLIPAVGQRRGRIALLSGCVQQVLAQEINWATIRVLAQNGIEVIIPSSQGCCGALALHTGDRSTALELGSQNIETFPSDVDAIITNAAGCGSCMKEYPQLFKGTELADQAIEFSNLVYDISVFLNEFEIASPPALQSEIKVAYHDACHLAHAQGVTLEPRHLLAIIPNLSLIPINESELCCGSAGSYNIEQPMIAKQLGKRKAENILNSGADLVATGNIGCLVQLRMHLDETQESNGNKRKSLPVWHTIEILDRAYKQSL
jgi:glycolate oxidase iron-sulfur subunit